jgi:hypothetical protein
MVENQVKYLYGKYYEKALNNEIIYIEEITEGNHIDYNSDEFMDISYDDIDEYVKLKNEKNNYTGWSPAFILKYFKIHYNFDKKTIFRFNLHDGPFTNNCNKYTGFYIGHSRYIQEDTNKPIITPYRWNSYLIERSNYIDNSDFYEKTDKLIFRGGTNGNPLFPKRDYKTTTRFQIISNNYDKYDGIDVGFSKLTTHSCDNNTEFLKNNMNLSEIFHNKFILCIGGNDWSSMFPEVLALSNCCAFHTYPFDFEDYYLCDIKPYEHFIPVKNDGSDIYAQYKWCLNNTEKCNEIVKNAHEYMKFYKDINIFNRVVQRFCELYPIVRYK